MLFSFLTSDEHFYVKEVKAQTLFTLSTYLEYSLWISHSFYYKEIAKSRPPEVDYLNMNDAASSDHLQHL